MKEPAVYILANQNNKVLYIGVTANLLQRVYQHKSHFIEGFTKKYNVDKLVYFEQFEDMTTAIKREKSLKKWSRNWKEQLIESNNPEWTDLWVNINK